MADPAPVRVVAPPPRLAPALLSPTSLHPRPLPTHPPSTHPVASERPAPEATATAGVVTALWNARPDEPAFELSPPHEPALNRSTTRAARRAIITGLIISLLAAGAIVAITGSSNQVPAFEARAEAIADQAREGLNPLREAVGRISDPTTTPAELSDSAAQIAELDMSARELLGVGRTKVADLTGGWRGLASSPPNVRFASFTAAGEAGAALEGELSALLTTRLILGSILALPELPVAPDSVDQTAELIGAAIAESRARVADLPPDHSEIAVDTADTISRVELASAGYLASLRNGEPGDEELAAITAEIDALSVRSAAHVAEAAAALRATFDTYAAFIAELG